MHRCCRSMGALAFTLLCFLYTALLVTVAMHHGGPRPTPPVAAATLDSSRGTTTGHMSLDPLSTSKRRVPHGPDPIHNRSGGNSGGTPGRA